MSPCYRPITAYRSNVVNSKTGKRSLVFNKSEAISPVSLNISCGRCIGCRLEYSRQWAVRCLHESKLREDNCFLTLTYDDEHLPANRSLSIDHYQRFLKRLRHHIGPFRYFGCGEYGDLNRRPHYHLLIFGYDFPDKELYTTRDDINLHTSNILQSIWRNGFSTVGDVTFDSAAYVARYTVKKFKGSAERKAEHYREIDFSTGECFDLTPEFVTMSRRPGIGRGFYELFAGDIFPSDFVVVNGVIQRPSKFYDAQLARDDPDLLEDIKRKRVLRGNTPTKRFHTTPERLAVREHVQNERNKLLFRPI